MKRFLAALAAAVIFVSCESAGGVRDTAAEEPPAEGQNPRIEHDYGSMPGDRVASIGAYVLTSEKLDMITAYMKDKFNYTLDEEQKKEFVEYIVNKKLMSMAAREEGYAERPDIKAKHEWDFDELVSHEYYKDKVDSKVKVTASEAQEYYARNKGEFSEIKGAHILVKSKSAAEALLKRIKSGETFEETAKKYSEDPTTAPAGGALGWFTKGVMVKEFEEAAFELGAEEVSSPVRTIYGWHLVKIYERRSISFDSSKERIMKIIREEKVRVAFEEMMKKLKEKNRVIINERYAK